MAAPRAHREALQGLGFGALGALVADARLKANHRTATRSEDSDVSRLRERNEQASELRKGFRSPKTQRLLVEEGTERPHEAPEPQALNPETAQALNPPNSLRFTRSHPRDYKRPLASPNIEAKEDSVQPLGAPSSGPGPLLSLWGSALWDLRL